MVLTEHYFNQAYVPAYVKRPILLPEEKAKWVSLMIWDLVKVPINS